MPEKNTPARFGAHFSRLRKARSALISFVLQELHMQRCAGAIAHLHSRLSWSLALHTRLCQSLDTPLHVLAAEAPNQSWIQPFRFQSQMLQEMRLFRYSKQAWLVVLKEVVELDCKSKKPLMVSPKAAASPLGRLEYPLNCASMSSSFQLSFKASNILRWMSRPCVILSDHMCNMGRARPRISAALPRRPKLFVFGLINLDILFRYLKRFVTPKSR